MSKKTKSDTLQLFLFGEWYDLIAKGVKTEEYRKVDYWCPRIVDQDDYDGFIGEPEKGKYQKYGILTPLHKYVCFHRGYTKTTMTFKIAGVDLGKGKTEWGWKPEDGDVIIIKLGERVK